MNVPSPFSGDGETAAADAYDAFVPEHEPDTGPFLAGQDVLTDREHAAVHRLARALFEERGVYDITFGYNLARLNLDRRHPEAGFRYARESDDPAVLRAEFTPTTEFCPQSDTLTKASFRAWNGLGDRHEFDLVRVRVSPLHHRAVAINGELSQLAETYRETGEVPAGGDTSHAASSGDRSDDAGDGAAPF